MSIYTIYKYLLIVILQYGSFSNSQTGDGNRNKKPSISGDDFDDDPSPRLVRQGNAMNFPIVLPFHPLGQSITTTKWGSCLLYIEGVSIVVFGKGNQPSSSIAKIVREGGNNKFNFADEFVSCPDFNDTKDKPDYKQIFTIELTFDKPVEAIHNKVTQFTVENPFKISLEFNISALGDWRLENVYAHDINIKAKTKSFIEKDLSISGKPMNDSTMHINGFYEYGYACSSTPSAILKLKDGYAVGVSFNNIQFQPFGAIKEKDGDKSAKVIRFGPNVNDCVGTFSIGSWMGIIVALLLFSVFYFGFLMLNSVQTMDRYDDPKQKQLIISSKE